MATPKYAIPEIVATAEINDGPADINAALNAIDGKFAGYSEGLLSAIPTSSSGSPGVAGREYYATDTGQRLKDTGTGWYEIQGAGDLKPTARAAAPLGWLLCDGSSQLRSAFPALFAALGGASSPYGLPDGTHFNLPDLRGRVPVGVDGAAGRLDALDALGNVGGEQKHTLTIAEMPSHRHDLSFGDAGSANFTSGPNTGRHWDPVLTDSAQIQPTGGGGVHNNMQPYQVFNWLVKT